MTRLADALRRRGALIEGRANSTFDAGTAPPLVIGPLEKALSSLEYESAVASSDLKTALLLSGLYADGATRLREPTVSRDHTERLLDALGVPIRTSGTIVQLDPSAWNHRLPAFDLTVPGDLSAAAFPIVAAQLVPGSRVTTRGVGVNPTHTGLLEVARDMGAGLTIEPQGERYGEPVAALHAWCAPLGAIAIGGETLQRATDEVHLACALASRAAGTTRVVFFDAHAQDDGVDADIQGHIEGVSELLRAFGVACAARPGALDIEGRDGPLDAALVDCRGDAAVAMTAVVLALTASGPTRVGNAGCIGPRYAKFVATMRALGARIEVEA
jgi:3-phosphoshikimate 1-carboxyvinyltransferase